MRFLMVVLTVLVLVLPADARRNRWGSLAPVPSGGFNQLPGQGIETQFPDAKLPPAKADGTPQFMLVEVNRLRALRGLPAYILDDNLQAAAASCALFRARNRIAGHCSNDFFFLPSGTSSTGAGCACWPNDGAFGACLIYSNARYAGAVTVVGSDGRAYHHLFVR